jgi:hypothetical protein
MGRQRPKDCRNQSTDNPTMTLDLATALLNRAANGAQLLEILETIANDEADANIADCGAYFESIQF